MILARIGQGKAIHRVYQPEPCRDKDGRLLLLRDGSIALWGSSLCRMWGGQAFPVPDSDPGYRCRECERIVKGEA